MLWCFCIIFWSLKFQSLLWLHAQGTNTLCKMSITSDLESVYNISLHCMCVCAPFRHFLTKRTHLCHLHPFTLRNLSDLWAEIVQLWDLITPPWQARDFITTTTRLIAPDSFPRRKHGNVALGFNEWPQTVFELSFVQCVTYGERYVRVLFLIKKSDCSALMLCVH